MRAPHTCSGLQVHLYNGFEFSKIHLFTSSKHVLDVIYEKKNQFFWPVTLDDPLNERYTRRSWRTRVVFLDARDWSQVPQIFTHWKCKKQDVNLNSHIASSPISQSSIFKGVRCLILASSQRKLRGYIKFL